MRKPDWPRLLNEYIAGAQARYEKDGFAWGRFDCCTFAFGWVETCTGDDPMADYRGVYDTEREARAALRKNGGGTLVKACRRYFGAPVAASFAQRGDIVYRKKEKCVGIVFTSGAKMQAAFLSEGGFSVLPATECDYAFRVQ